MKRLLRLATRLYPKRWRNRYSREFDALLDDMNPRWRDVLNLVNGALMMHSRNVSAVLLVCGLAGALIGVAISRRTPDLYESAAMVRLHLDELPQTGRGRDLAIGNAIRSALEQYTHSREATRIQFVRAIAGSSTPVLEVSVSDADGTTAQKAMQEVVGLMERDTVAHPRSLVRFEMLTTPTLPHRLRPQIHAGTIALGCGMGLALGGLVSWGRRRLQRNSSKL